MHQNLIIKMKLMTGLFKPVIAICLLLSATSISFGQDIATWKGSVITAPAKEVPAGNGMVEIIQEASTTLQLSLQQDGAWNIIYDSGNGHTEEGSSNISPHPLLLLLKINIFDSALTINGALSPDSSSIICTIINGSSKTNLVLHRMPPPVSWNGDTTINGNRTIINLTYKNDPQWEIILQNDSIGVNPLYQNNEADSGKVMFSLSSSFDESSSDRRIEGTISPDSSSIAGTLFMNDSIKFPITLYKGKKNIEEFQSKEQRISANFIWWRWAIGWAIIGVIIFLFFMLRKKYSPVATDASVLPPADDWLKKILPVVRISCEKKFGGKRKVLVVYNDAIVIFHTNKKTNFDEVHNENSQALINTIRGLKNIKNISLNSIEKIEVEKESRLGKVRFHIHYSNKKENFVLPGYEMPNILKALQSLTGDRLHTGCFIRFHNFGIWIQLLIFSFTAVYIYTNLLSSDAGFWIILYIILFIVVLYRIVFLLFSSIIWFMDHLPRKIKSNFNTKPKSDLSHRKPLRSVSIAIFLKIAGASIFVLTFLIIKQQYLPAAFQSWAITLGPFLPGFLIICGYLLVGLILNLSLAFANRNPKTIHYNNKPPILYLRSFLDDRETTFQPGTWLSYFLGVDPPYYQLNKYTFNSTSLYYRLQKKIFKYLYNNHPIRMLRLILGWPVDTSEQQLGLYFRKKGPFVAIGKPGERIITSGANRMYVTNEEWQNVILDYLHKSQLVVLQPSSTEGIWWEINQSLNIVEPNRLFLCMVNYKGHQNFYEDFRLRIEDLKAEIQLPRFIGNAKEICFFRFDETYTPQLLRLKYKNFIYWPFQGNAADLKNSMGV